MGCEGKTYTRTTDLLTDWDIIYPWGVKYRLSTVVSLTPYRNRVHETVREIPRINQECCLDLS